MVSKLVGARLQHLEPRFFPLRKVGFREQQGSQWFRRKTITPPPHVTMSNFEICDLERNADLLCALSVASIDMSKRFPITKGRTSFGFWKWLAICEFFGLNPGFFLLNVKSF